MNERMIQSLRVLTLTALVGFFPMVVKASEPTEGRGAEVGNDVTVTLWSILLPEKAEVAPNLEQMSAAIARLGREALQPSVAILFGDVPEPQFTYSVHPWVIDRRQDVLVGALRQFRNGEVVAAVRAQAASAPDPDRSILAARILGRIGGREALEGIEALASGLDAVQWQRPFVVTVFQEGLVAIAKEDARNVRAFANALARAQPRFAPVFAHALGVAQWPSSVPVLLRAMGRDRELDLCIMAELAQYGDRGDVGGALGDIRKLRSYCEGTDAGLQRIAASALARLGDDESCGAMIAMLDGKNTLTINSAEKALTQLTGLALGRNSKPWTKWREHETEWFETNYARLQEELASGEAGRVADAVRDLAGHRLFRHQAALAVLPLLGTADADLQRQGCIALGLLGSSRALPALLDKLEASDEGVRTAAHAALRKLTGLDLPPDVNAWRPVIVAGG